MQWINQRELENRENSGIRVSYDLLKSSKVCNNDGIKQFINFVHQKYKTSSRLLSHANASVFFNRYRATTASIGNIVIQVQPAKQLLSGNNVAYSQRPLIFNAPNTSTAPPSPRPVTTRETSGFKRKQEESHALLLEALQQKRAKIDELKEECSILEEQETLSRRILDL